VNIFFDVDFTLITWDYRLRPHVREVFQRLKDDGHIVYLWSGVGKRWEVVEQHGLAEYVQDCFEKPLFRHAERLDELGVSVRPDFVIDDHEEPVAAFGGAVIRPPDAPLDADREMLRIYEAIRAFCASDDR
jgi:SAM-dependent methyltransferase